MRLLIGVLLAAAIAVQGVQPAIADPEVTPGTDPLDPGVVGGATSEEEGTQGSDAEPVSSGSQVEYVWLLNCSENYPGSAMVACAAANLCPGDGEFMWVLWARALGGSASSWTIVGRDCREDPPPGADPVVTDDLVLNEVRRLGLPRLTVRVQPAGETLVNLDTIFYAEPPEWARTVQLLGYTVDVQASPASYSWSFGDGSATTTDGPGAPYPATDIVHAYEHAGVQVRPAVDVAYQVRYRVDGGAWQTIEDTVPAAGYPTDLVIREATPVLVGD